MDGEVRMVAGAVAGALIAAGVVLAVLPPAHTRRDAGGRSLGARAARRGGGLVVWLRARRWRLLGAGAAGMVAVAATGWPVAAVLAAAGGWWLPGMLGPDRGRQSRQRSAEALAGWTDGLRDVLSAAAGLQQALLATAGTAPAAIRDPVQRLAGRIRGGQRLPDALRAFASEIDDPLGDLIAAALIGAAQHQARQLGPLLGRLADTARAHAAAAQRIATARTASRTTLRIITGTVMAAVVLLVAADRSFLAPYQSPGGQLVLLAVGGLFASGLAWVRKLATPPTPPRTLNLAGHDATTGAEAGA